MTTVEDITKAKRALTKAGEDGRISVCWSQIVFFPFLNMYPRGMFAFHNEQISISVSDLLTDMRDAICTPTYRTWWMLWIN
jgi:hypothetical protein